MQADARMSPALRELREASSHADVVYKKFVRELIPSLSKELAAFGFRYLHLPPTSNSGMHVPNRALYANNDVEAPHGASHPTTH